MDIPAGLVVRIDHVGLAVHDVSAVAGLWERAFGARVVHQEVNEGQQVREVMLQIGESPSLIQLLEPLDADSPIGRFLAGRGEGIQQLAVTVTDLAAVSVHLREQGLRLLYDAPRAGTSGSLINFVHPKDCHGVLVELVEPAPAAH